MMKNSHSKWDKHIIRGHDKLSRLTELSSVQPLQTKSDRMDDLPEYIKLIIGGICIWLVKNKGENT